MWRGSSIAFSHQWYSFSSRYGVPIMTLGLVVLVKVETVLVGGGVAPAAGLLGDGGWLQTIFSPLTYLTL
jgi:hypothetical protein